MPNIFCRQHLSQMQRTPPASPFNATIPSTSAQNQPNPPKSDTQTNIMDQNNATTDGNNQPSASTSTGEIHRVTVKPIQFIKTAPKLYFIQMEAQFNLAGITRDTTKYNHVLGTLDPNYLTSVMDLIECPPAANKYESIKERIIAEFQQSDQHQLRILLREIELGDLKPSQLLRKMKELSKNALSDDALKTLWIERLPEQIRPVISISDGDLNKVAIMADKMLEITSYNVIGEVATHATFNHHEPQIATLSKQIEELSNRFSQFSNDHSQRSNSNNRGRSQSRDNSRNRERSSSRTRNNSPYCYYHFKFGAMARKCNDPCKFKAEAETKNNNTPKN